MKPVSILSCFSKAAALSATVLILSACGQRGPLIHPSKDKVMKGSTSAQGNTTAPAANSTVAKPPEGEKPAVPVDNDTATPSAVK